MSELKIGVIGGGASGMMAAITAAKNGAKVTLLEGGDRVGKKILSTGNGKCNLGNTDLKVSDYCGANPDWISQCLAQFDTNATIAFFEDAGMLIKNKNGYLYPLAEQASVVLDVLRGLLKSAGVEVITECKVMDVTIGKQGKFCVKSQDKKFEFDRVILACGSKAAPKTGSDGSGYDLAKKLGHAMVPVVPALVQLCCEENYLKEIAGVRAEAVVRVLNETECIEEQGELQLTDYGISGIPVFQLSRKVGYILRKRKNPVVAEIDFLPQYTEEELDALFETRYELIKNLIVDQNIEEFFTGILNKKLMLLFIKLAGLKREQTFSSLKKADLKRVFGYFKHFQVHITGSKSFENAQVCAGGVNTEEVKTTMESAVIPGLFFAGELLDVDGRCGGYNLQWAWCSGYLAGKNAAKG